MKSFMVGGDRHLTRRDVANTFDAAPRNGQGTHRSPDTGEELSPGATSETNRGDERDASFGVGAVVNSSLKHVTKPVATPATGPASILSCSSREANLDSPAASHAVSPGEGSATKLVRRPWLRRRLVVSLHAVPFTSTLDHVWWGNELETRARALAEVCAIDIHALAASAGCIALLIATRPDVAKRWSVDDTRRRYQALLGMRNIFVDRPTLSMSTTKHSMASLSACERALLSGTAVGEAERDASGSSTQVASARDPSVRIALRGSDPVERARVLLSCDRTFRRELFRWTWIRRCVGFGFSAPIVKPWIRASSTDRGDPALFAAGLLSFLAFSDDHRRAQVDALSVQRSMLSAHSQQEGDRPRLFALRSARHLSELVEELRIAPHAPRSARPRMEALRAILEPSSLSSMQRLAVKLLDHPLISCQSRNRRRDEVPT